MSLLGRVLGEHRASSSTLAQPSPELIDALGAGDSYSGRSVSIDSSLRLIPVYSAVSLLAGAVGSLPLMVYRRLDRGRERATNHWMWSVLHDQPNPSLGADEMWELVTLHLLTWGNAFLWKMTDGIHPVSELYPIRPDRVQVGIDAGSRYFVVDGKGPYTESDILHIRFLGTDGVVGLSPIQQARQALSAHMEIEEYTGRFYANSGVLGGALKHPNRLSQEAQDRLKRQWKSMHSGAKRSGEVAVLEEGMDFQQTTVPLEDAQFIDTRRFGLLEIALLFRVPPKMMAAATGDSLTYTSSEWESLDFVRWSLRRILVRLEGSLLRDGDLFLQGRRFYPEFLVDAMLRGTTQERFNAYAVALDPTKGWMTRDEVRELENLPPEPDPPKPPALTSTPPVPALNGSTP